MHWNAICAIISFIIEIGFLLEVDAKRKDSSGYKTTYACEGRTLHIRCDEGIIHLIRANFGRFSISICNDHGNLDWSVNCMSHQSFLVMQDRCSLKPNCSINVSSNTFHDPCPGTLKYLEVQYHCGKDPPIINVHPSSSSHLMKALLPTNATPTSGPPPAIPSAIPPKETFTLLRTTLTTVTEETPVSIPWSYKDVKELFTQINVTTEEILYKEILPSPTTNDFSNANYCVSTTSRGIRWMSTKAGEIAVEKCPDGATGNARWHCLSDTVEWNPEQPDLHQCRSLWLENLKERLENGESINSISSELAQKTQAKPLFSADLQIISDLIKQALHKSANSLENFLDTWHRYNVLRELLQSFVQILNNLLETKQSAAWTDLPPHDRKMIISSLLHGLDESALLLSEISNDDSSFSLVKSNVLLSLQILNSKTLQSFHFPIRNEIHPDENGITWLNMQDSLSLPRQAVRDYSTNGLYKVVFTAFNKLNIFLKPSSSFPYHNENSSSGNVTRIINSKIIGASLDRGGYPKLHQPVVITLKHLIEENVTNPICVYWDFSFRDWSTQGCWVQMSNRSHTVCFCEHLTNFALVMDLRPDIVIPIEMETVYLIIAIGCSVAIFSFLITNILMFAYDLDMPDDGVFIHRNIFFCLLLAEIVLFGGNRDSVFPLVCAIMAGCLQYLLLATFSWMLLECYHQYGTLVRSCDVKKRSACWYYAAAYIVPGLVTGISAAVNPSTYGSGEYCWLEANNYFIFSFVTPAAIMIFGGFVFIILSVCVLSQNVVITHEKDSVALIKHRSWNRRSLFLIISSSITWIIGLFFLSQESLFLAYTFSVLNSAHSGTIMILYCFCYEKDSRDIRRVFSDFFWKKNKEQEPQISEQPVINANDSLQCSTDRFRSLKQEKLYEKPSTKDCDVDQTSSGNGTYKFGRGSMPRCMRTSTNWNYTSRNVLGGNTTDSSSSGECHQTYPASPESSGQFFEHIYEAIDEQITGTQHSGVNRSFPPPENYYGDHSDISQQSSSSSGYNHQTPQGQVSGQGQTSFSNAYSLNRSPVPEQSQDIDYTWEYKNQLLDKEASQTIGSTLTTSDENAQSSASGVLWQKNSFENWEPQLSNIIQSPTENSVVLAVLEGDKVVSRIQQDDALLQKQYKISSYY